MFKASFNGNFNGYNFNPNFKQSNTKKTKHFIICLIIKPHYITNYHLSDYLI